MIPRLTIVVLILILMASGAINPITTARTEDMGKEALACPDGARILETGEFHGDEVEAETGERWLGLHISGDQSVLLEYQLTVEAVHDPITDERDERTGKKVSVDLPVEPRFLIDAEWLSAGAVQTVLEGNYEKALERKSPITLKLAGTSYELKVVGSEDSEQCAADGFPRNARLILSSDTAEQVLYTLEDCGNDPAWFLLWAGDLDRDGKLDLYLSLNQHYNVSEKKLFLSSEAAEGRLVEQVAEFVTSGC